MNTKKTKVKSYIRKGKIVKSYDKSIKNKLKKAAIAVGTVGALGVGGFLLRKKIKNYNNFLKHNKKGTLVRYDPELAKSINKNKNYIIKNQYGLNYAMKEKYGDKFDYEKEFKQIANIYNNNIQKNSATKAAGMLYKESDAMRKEFLLGVSRIEKEDAAIKELRNNIFKDFIENNSGNIKRYTDKYNSILRAMNDKSIGEAERLAYKAQLFKYEKRVKDLDIKNKLKDYGFNDSDIDELSKLNNISFRKNNNLITFARKKGSKDKKKRQSKGLSDYVKLNTIFGGTASGIGGFIQGKQLLNNINKQLKENRNATKATLKRLRFIKDNKDKLPFKEKLYSSMFKVSKGKLKANNKIALGLGAVGVLTGGLASGLQSSAIESFRNKTANKNKNNV